MAQLDEIARRVKGPCELLKLKDCGHAPFRDQSEKTVEAVARFVDRNRVRA
jgi:pimeloyl-ACP methyl ester carboxylesterase